jgi:hypothetical protein
MNISLLCLCVLEMDELLHLSVIAPTESKSRDPDQHRPTGIKVKEKDGSEDSRSARWIAQSGTSRAWSRMLPF